MDTVLNDLEAKTNYHFYYDKAVFDSLRVTMQVSSQPLTAVLDLIFKDTPFRYAFVGKDVFLTKTRVVQTAMAPGFFEPLPPGYVRAKGARNSINAKADKTVIEATTENKTYEVGPRTNTIGKGMATMAGYVRESKTGEPVVGASMYVTDIKSGIATDQFGFYSLTLPKGPHTILITAIGSQDTRRRVILYSDGKLNMI